MDTPNPDPSWRPLPITVEPAPGVAVLPSDDPHVVCIKLPVVRVAPADIVDANKRPTSAATPASPAATTTPAEPPVASSTIDPKTLPDDANVLKQVIADLLRALRRERKHRQEVEQRLAALLKRLYGPRPERLNPAQGSLFTPADLPPAPPPAPPAAEEKPSRRGKCRPHGRRRPAKDLRHEVRRYELTAAERLCPECGHERHEIGVETSPQYDYKPAEVFIVDHQRVKYACTCCEAHVAIAPKPAQPIDKGLPAAGLLAQIIVDKYLYHLPLHRSEQRFLGLGVYVPRSTMCDWMAACAERLTPLVDLLKVWVLQSKVLHTDDTTVPVRDEQRSNHRYGRLWNYIGDAAHPGLVFDYTATHARDGPATFLKGFSGFLQADAYSAYDGIYLDSQGAIIEVGCWAHARGKFAEAATAAPEQVLVAKAFIRKLYDVEDEAEGLSAAARLRLRQEKSVPLLASLRQWLLDQKVLVLPKNPLATAINYVLNQWQALCRYTTDGDLHIDNNVSERALKLIGMGRDNWLFLGSDQGGKTAAVLYSFTATCKLLKLDAFTYLRDVLERLPTHPVDRLEELLPHRWQAARLASAPVLPILPSTS
jgi:transposase